MNCIINEIVVLAGKLFVNIFC